MPTFNRFVTSLSKQKNAFLFCMSLLIISACGSFKPVTSTPTQPTTSNPKPSTTPKTEPKKDDLGNLEGKKKKDKNKPSSQPTGTSNPKGTEKVDTILWVSRADAPAPIKSPIPVIKKNTPEPEVITTPEKPNNNNNNNPSVPSSNYYGTYNVTFVLPFMSNKIESTEPSSTSTAPPDATSEKALNFYAGAKLALYHLESEGVNLNVSTFDSKGSATELSGILNRSESQNAHLIIGGRSKAEVQTMAEFAKKEQKVFVSPWNPSTDISSNNPFYVQISPSLKTHCEAIFKHAAKRYGANQVRLLCKNENNEIARLKYFQDENKVENGTTAERLKELVMSEGSAQSLDSYMVEGDTTVFLMPTWNEQFVMEMMRKIYTEKRGRPVVIYGMPQWLGFTRLSYEYMEKLNVHVSTANFVDRNSEKIKLFSKDYYLLYGNLPSEDAFLGYDVTLYVARMLAKNGSSFQLKMEQEPNDRLHTRFEFANITAAGDDSFSNVQLIENLFVNIVRFKNFYFQKVN